MEITDGFVIHDRAVVISSRRELDEFLSNPKGFLERVGALKGLEEFNGFIREDGSEIEDLRSHLRDKDRAVTAHLGVPYKEYCKWIIYN